MVFALPISRVAGRCYHRPAPSEPDELVSKHPAQAIPTPAARRGFTTSTRWLWTCLWQFGCKSTRLSAVSAPPFVRQTTWWLCHPVSSVIVWLQTGHIPSCSFQRCSNCRRPRRLLLIFTPRRSSKYTSQAGSYGFAAPLILTCRLIGTSRA